MIMSNYRDTFKERIFKGLIGAGSDSFGLPDEEEILSDYPLQRYFSAIIFPEKEFSATQEEEYDSELALETEEANLLAHDENEEIIFDEPEEGELEVKKSKEKDVDDKPSYEHFYPNNIGMTFCIEQETEEIEIEFSGGFYNAPEQSEIKIKMPEAGYNAFLNEKTDFPFKDILVYEDGFLSLSRKLKGHIGGKNPRSEEYLDFDEYKKSDSYKNSSAKNYIEYFEKLIGRTWKRRQFRHSTIIKIEDTDKQPVDIPISEKTHEDVSLGYHVKTYLVKGNKYVKIQLVNTSKKQFPKRFTPKTPELNSKSLFQAEIKVKSNQILPYKSNQDLNPFDSEIEELNFLYREIESYGIGHNCSVTWNKEGNTYILQTTFLPEFNVKNVINDFGKDDFDDPNDFDKLDQSLDIKNLSLFSKLKKDEINKRLKNFVELYGKWIGGQKEKNKKETEKEIGNRIIERLDYNYNRLKENIESLTDDNVFRAFQFANTAMLIQFIISKDKDFAEKEVSKINVDIPYNDLNFFSEYDYTRLTDGPPKYRPFQLAFLLLNIKGITKPRSDDRNNVVDLIWFPTGGGKTEAYLAVTAFTIVWRRMTNKESISKGVSVIMRYTLRLLTAQQFERASKLIASLEFLRKNHETELKKEPISIGLWVGNQLTPGKIDEARVIVNQIQNECTQKGGNPESKNTFQISACPWCGTKLISKRESEWKLGLEIVRQSFIIKCINEECTFHDKIPVQVVDEMLYKQPPTLLFATVDKFAQLAQQEKAHGFFNSLDKEKLPPDLIIQDELHLLSGPLGSIVGLFESVVENICTNEKEGITPKIIASTATTRNTAQQIQQLYGGRRVNVFPPAGLSYRDSFFAKESKYSRRKYIGFMPVGKTPVDTQLQVIAHLLVARVENKSPKDNYWTVVSYYNSLKDVGKIGNKVGDEIKGNTAGLQSRLFGKNDTYKYNHYGLVERTEELTSRINSSKIKTVLKQLENSLELTDRVSEKGNSYKMVKSGVIDLVLATNMFSVGIDIGRLNLMLINGMPKNIAEYIQASSRVGREDDGLVVTLLSPTHARDKSYFEHYIPFHQAFYKNVEPLSVTPFTENTIDKMLTTLMITYVRHKIPGLNGNSDAHKFQIKHINELKTFLEKRFGENHEYKYFEKRIDFLANDWAKRDGITYKNLIKKPTDEEISQDADWVVMQSMREIDYDTFIIIRESFKN